MKFCLASENITPTKSVFMHGFGDTSRKSEGVLDPLYMKAALLQANKTLLIVTIDALGSDRSFIIGMKEALREQFGLNHDEVLINFSHTHHSVFLTGIEPSLRRGGYSIGQSHWMDDDNAIDYTEDEAYFKYIRDTLLGMVSSCYAKLIPGELLIGKGHSDFAVSRRRPLPNGGVEWKPYYEANIDKDLFVFKLVDEMGSVKGILYSYGCHTTAMGSENRLFSNDYAGVTSSVIENAYPGATAMFLQGCGGELKPIQNAEGDRFVSGDARLARKAGEYLAKDVIGIMEQGKFTRIDCHFRTELCDLLLYTEQVPVSVYENLAAAHENVEFYHSAAIRTIRAMENGTIKDRIPFYISIWHLDESTQLVALEGEVSTAYSLLLKQLFNKEKMIVLGYSNGVFCYIPSRKMVAEGGYETECHYFFGLMGPFVPEIEDIIVGQVAQSLLCKSK